MSVILRGYQQKGTHLIQTVWVCQLEITAERTVRQTRTSSNLYTSYGTLVTRTLLGWARVGQKNVPKLHSTKLLYGEDTFTSIGNWGCWCYH